MKKELETLQLENIDNFWREVVTKIDFNPDAVLPVELMYPGTSEPFGKFYISINFAPKNSYIQFENFDSLEMADIFFKSFNAKWEIFPGGIYRVQI